MLKTPSDFVGEALGVSEKLTRSIVEASRGCVLVIDEAYGLHGAGGVGSGAQARTAPVRCLRYGVQETSQPVCGQQ